MIQRILRLRYGRDKTRIALARTNSRAKRDQTEAPTARRNCVATVASPWEGILSEARPQSSHRLWMRFVAPQAQSARDHGEEPACNTSNASTFPPVTSHVLIPPVAIRYPPLARCARSRETTLPYRIHRWELYETLATSNPNFQQNGNTDCERSHDLKGSRQSAGRPAREALLTPPRCPIRAPLQRLDERRRYDQTETNLGLPSPESTVKGRETKQKHRQLRNLFSLAQGPPLAICYAA